MMCWSNSFPVRQKTLLASVNQFLSGPQQTMEKLWKAFAGPELAIALVASSFKWLIHSSTNNQPAQPTNHFSPQPEAPRAPHFLGSGTPQCGAVPSLRTRCVGEAAAR